MQLYLRAELHIYAYRCSYVDLQWVGDSVIKCAGDPEAKVYIVSYGEVSVFVECAFHEGEEVQEISEAGIVLESHSRVVVPSGSDAEDREVHYFLINFVVAARLGVEGQFDIVGVDAVAVDIGVRYAVRVRDVAVCPSR